jgi:hypothetical protein
VIAIHYGSTIFNSYCFITEKVQPGKQSAKPESTKKEETGRSASRTVADCEKTGKYIAAWLMCSVLIYVIAADHVNGTTTAHGPTPQPG